MSEPPGQIRTEIPPSTEGASSRAAISAGREVEQGARSVLILAEGLFRLDVIPHDDTIQTIVRSLAPESTVELRLGDVGGAASVSSATQGVALPSTGRFGGKVVLVAEDGAERVVAKILVGSVHHPERGVTSFTAQATLL
jgi:hypothetical protein